GRLARQVRAGPYRTRPRQARPAIVWGLGRRHYRPHGRRVVQEHGRHRRHVHSVQRRPGRHPGPAGRPPGLHLRELLRSGAADPGRPGARAGSEQPAPPGTATGCADARRARTEGLTDGRLGRRRGAQGHPARRHRTPEWRLQQGTAGTHGAGRPGQARRRARPGVAGRLQAADRQRNRQMAADHRPGRHRETGLTARMQADFILSDATVVDGSGSARQRAHIAVSGQRIAQVGDFAIPAGVPVIDARGLVAAPGFIDSHTHDDGYLLAHPDMTPKVSQGITTVVTGNCGISLAPLAGAAIPQPLDLLGPPALFRFDSFAGWIAALRATPAAVNVVPLVGHTTLRVAARGDGAREADATESGRMRGLLEEALEAGAFGVSTGTFYPPAAAATTREIIDVCQPLRGRAGIYATHLRDEADHIVPAMEEALEIGRALQCRVVFSHHTPPGARNHGRPRQTLDLISQAARRQPVCLDCHPSPATSTMLRLDRVRLAQRTLVTWSKGYPAATGR